MINVRLIKQKKLLELNEKVASLQSQINSAQSFIKEIENGNLSTEINKDILEKDSDNALATSLLSMREQMSRIAEEEKKRNWTTEGLARFVDILRSKNDDLMGLGDSVISNIVRYMNANQGSLYILNDDDTNDLHLELIACYAYDRKKHRTQKIGLGEGLVGQAVLEKGVIYMTNLPPDYLKITSGLGEALPRNLLIVPLIINEKVFGVIELASFNVFQDHHRSFIQKLAESIASTISNVKVNQQTRKLLQESQIQAEAMRSQEEEMRQNMEELTATQEEMQRVLKEVQLKEGYLNELINASTDSIFTADADLKLISWNKVFQKTQEAGGVSVYKGYDLLHTLNESEREASLSLYKRALAGESFEVQQSFNLYGNTLHFLLAYSPLRNAQGDVFAVAVFAKDVTKMVDAQNKAEQLKNEAQHQAEELKAQEEELRQNMEELSATQDEMQRILNEVQLKELYLSELINASKDSIFTVDRDLKLVSWNKVFQSVQEAAGVKVEKGADSLHGISENERQSILQLYDRAFKGETFEISQEISLHGKSMHFLAGYSPMRNDKNEVVSVAVFAKDITEMVSAQKEVQAKEKYLNELLNASKDSIFTVDRDLKLSSWNKVYEATQESAGISVQKGFDTLVAIEEKDRKPIEALYQRAFAGEAFEFSQEFTVYGKKMHFLVSYSPMRNENNEVTTVAVFAKDVSEMVAAQKEVQEKELYLNELLNSSTDAIFTVDRGLRLVSWNRVFQTSQELGGLSVEKGMDTLQAVPESQRAAIRALYERAFKGEAFELTQEFTLHGNLRHFLVGYNPMRNEQNEVTSVAVFAKDITEMVTAQRKVENLMNEAQNQAEELRAQEEEMRQNLEELSASQEEIHRIMKAVEAKEAYATELLNASTDMIFTIDRNYRLVSWNKTFAASLEQYGSALEKGMSTLDWYPDEVQRTYQKGVYDRALNGESFEISFSTPANGTTMHFRTSHKPLRNEKGEIYEVAVFARDVTAEKQNHLTEPNEEKSSEVEHAELFLQEMMNGSKHNIYIVDRDYRFSHFNESFAATLKRSGISVHKGTHSLEIISNKKERDAVRKQLERVFNGEQFDYVQEFTSKGKVFHAWTQYKPIKNAQGEVVAAGVYSEDITELVSVRKLNEELLRQVRNNN